MGLKKYFKILKYSVKNVRQVYFLALLCSLISLAATYDEIVNDKNRQIENVRNKIDECRQLILSNSIIIDSCAQSSDSLSTIINSLNDFLKDYKDETYLSADQVAIETKLVMSLEDEVERIQSRFRNKIINLYKHGKNYELELLLSSKTPNEFLRRNQYLQRFAQTRKKELRELKSKKFMLEEKKKMLKLSTSSRRFFVESKRNEKAQLEEKFRSIGAKKKQVEFQSNICSEKISRLELELTGLKTFLNNFSDHKEEFKQTESTRLNYAAGNLELLKGKLNSPLDISLVRNEFGRLVNNTTNSESFNNGIDFSAAEGSKVYSVAAGTVTLVGVAPHYGKTVIIDHGNGYKTVYAVLGGVSVKPGDKVKLNQILGKCGSNLEGQGLHFELWKDKTPLNPREWIRI